ncbi:MAG: RrF2 family transcriptional regulator [Planctomycetota bacterium]
MTHIYTRGCEYALRALQVMAATPDQPSTVFELCEKADIPEHFTRKMLQPLVRADILKSTRGPGGGFTFSRDPADISLIEVVNAIESGPRIDRCILGHKSCDDTNPCPLHYVWHPIKQQALDMLQNCTVADLALDPRP